MCILITSSDIDIIISAVCNSADDDTVVASFPNRFAWYQENNAVKANKIPAEDSSVEPYFIYAIIMSVVTVREPVIYQPLSREHSVRKTHDHTRFSQAITLLVVLVMRKRIALVMQLFREAGKAVCAMPALLLQPIYVSIFQLYPAPYFVLSKQKNVVATW